MEHVHAPVFVQEVLEHLVSQQDRFFLDCTTGEGGHSEAILYNYKDITVYGIDRDKAILEVASKRLAIFDGRFRGVNINFTDARDLPVETGFEGFDAALIDLGISVFHYKKSQRGFSFANSEELDMRLDESGISAFDIVNSYSQEELANIFFTLGEERFSRQIARRIVAEREKEDIRYADRLADIVASAIPAKFRGKKIHPATKVFQALRIVANDELENIRRGIPAVLSKLKIGGKLGVITFHSIEDRIVKHLFKEMSRECVCPPTLPVCACDKQKEVDIIGKVIKPTKEEIERNPPSRSAKLRIVERLL